MKSFKKGQAVWSSFHKEICIIIGESVEPKYSYYVVMRRQQNSEFIIHTINHMYLSAYVYHCWNCNQRVDSSIDYTCSTCKWVICSNCGACKKKACEPIGFKITNDNE